MEGLADGAAKHQCAGANPLAQSAVCGRRLEGQSPRPQRMLDLETGDGMKIHGLGAFQKTLDDAQHAISSLDGQIGSVQLDPSDARSVVLLWNP